MTDSEIILNGHRLQGKRVAFYQQSAFIEATTANNDDMYYLFFYKSKFLTASKTTKLRPHSFIETAFKKGIVFHAPHPIMQLISTNSPCQVINFQQLLKKLTTQFSPQEKAFILTFFESFISKKMLFEEMKTIFYEYRRNGQMYLAYQITRILMEFAPDHSFVKRLNSDPVFYKFAALYDAQSEKVLSKDRLFAEIVLHSKNDPTELFAFLQKEQRWIEVIAHSLNKFMKTPTEATYLSFKNTVKNIEIWPFLQWLYPQYPDFLPLQQDVLHEHIQRKDSKSIFSMVSDRTLDLTHEQLLAIADWIGDDITHLPPDLTVPLLKILFEKFPDKKEPLLTKYTIEMFRTHDLAYIQQWLQPFTNADSLRLVGKINEMHKLSDDPDGMQVMGERYFEFHQFDKAIECFNWEMELEPTNPKPVHWLAKCYAKKGLTADSHSYQQLWKNLQKLG